MTFVTLYQGDVCVCFARSQVGVMGGIYGIAKLYQGDVCVCFARSQEGVMSGIYGICHTVLG